MAALPFCTISPKRSARNPNSAVLAIETEGSMCGKSIVMLLMVCVGGLSVWGQKAAPATTPAAGQSASQPANPGVVQPFENSMVLISYAVTASSGDSSQEATKPPKTLSVMNGTGFLLFGEVGISKAKVYLVTNRHLLPPEGQPKDIQLRLVVREKDGAAKIEEISVPIVGSDGKYLPSVRVHRDPATDVAAVNIARAAFGSKFESLIQAIKTGRYLNSSMLLATQRMSAEGVGKGSQVYILGYPAAIFDPRNISPVLRVGWISTDPQEGFNFSPELRTMNFPEHINGFLLDANIYPGSAGSLVVLATGQRPYILGIVSGSIPIFDASLHASSRIGLGMVYSADTIREVLDSFAAAPGDVPGERAYQTSIMSSPDTWLELEPAHVEPPPMKAEPAVPVSPAAPVWSISEGVLQKSNDGRTWAPEIVPSRVPLRALFVSGQDIWTGGDQGVLYHSTDAGQTWTAVVPTSVGLSLLPPATKAPEYLDICPGLLTPVLYPCWPPFVESPLPGRQSPH